MDEEQGGAVGVVGMDREKETVERKRSAGKEEALKRRMDLSAPRRGVGEASGETVLAGWVQAP